MTHYASWRDVPASAWTWPNFSPREIACKGTGRLRLDRDAMNRLQALRAGLGKPILLTSAYRSPEHNARVGGAKGSLHLQGKAFDVRMENQNPSEFEEAAKAAGFHGIGYYPKQGFMHIDTGPARTWGTPFAVSDTNLAVEPTKRTSITQSTTAQASVAQIASGAGASVAAVSALDGTAQIVIAILGGVVVLAAVWILRERLRKWAAGDR